MSECHHDLAEKETACADGLCPICMKETSDALRPQLEEVLESVKRFGTVIEEMKAECLDLWKMIQAHTEQLRMAQVALSGEGDLHLEAVWRSIDQHLIKCARLSKERAEKYEKKVNACSPNSS